MRAQLSGKKWMFLEVLTKLVLEKAIERIELRNLHLEEQANDVVDGEKQQKESADSTGQSQFLMEFL